MMVVAHAYTDAVLAPDDTAEERYAAALAARPTGRCHVPDCICTTAAGCAANAGASPAPHLLRLARAEFDRVGAQPWAEMAREQLRATGESNGRRHAHG